MKSWYQLSRIRGIYSKLESCELLNLKNENFDLGLLVKEFKTSKNVIPMPNYDTINISKPNEIENILSLVSSKLSSKTTALIPFQINEEFNNELMLEYGDKLILRNDSFYIDCSQSLESLVGGVSKRKRSRARKYNEKGIDFKINDPEALSRFYEDYFFTADYLGFKKSSLMDVKSIDELLALEQTCVISASLDGNIVLSHLVGLNADKKNAEFVFAAYSSKSSNSLSFELVWFTINYLKLLGVRSYHLGGGVTPGDGLENFKRQFGGVRVRNFCIPIVLNREIYSRCLLQAGISSPDHSYFPAYLKGN